MIQRIQSILLFLTALIFGTLFLVPFAISNKPSVQFLADGVFDITDHPVLLGMTILGALISLISIFQYKKRRVQLKLGYLIIVVGILLLIAAVLLFIKASETTDATVEVSDQAGLYMPPIAIILAGIANYFIKKDDKLVKSMDRLR